MNTPTSAGFLSHVGSAALPAVRLALSEDFPVDTLPEIAKEAWQAWTMSQPDSRHRRAEVTTCAGTDPEIFTESLAEMVKTQFGAESTEVKKALAQYLGQIPSTIRYALRRPSDPVGVTLPPEYSIDRPDDLLPFLPVRLPRFQPGDNPLGGVDWQLVELLGIGGFGEVWKARNPNLESSPAVALKFCLDAASARVLRNEAKLLDRLMLQGRHPGIVPLRQTYLNAEPPCLEYEWVPGGNLAGAIGEWHRRQQGPSIEQIAKVMLRLSSIIAFAHRLSPSIVHRDLKPANILVQRMPDGKLSMRIADFGNGGVAASHAIRQTLRGTSQTQLLMSALRGACTPLYASPQQMRGLDPDPRDDVYALGVIWYQILTGELTSGRPGGTRWPKRLADQGMPTAFVDLLGSCFEDNPDDRPRTATELAEQISQLLQENPIPVVQATPAPEGPGTAPVVPALPRRITNSLQMTLTHITEGTFKMGSPYSEADRSIDELQHEVTLSKPFHVGIYAVTQRQYEMVMGVNPSYNSSNKAGGPDFPVERVSWSDAVEFCKRLSDRPEERNAGRLYRLPTEAEWEYLCRAGQPTAFSSGPSINSHEANFNGAYPYGGASRGPYLERTTKVGSYSPNPFGLYEVHGNVWEWCQDWYERPYYKNSPKVDPPGPTTGEKRVVRGGSCFNIARFCRSAYRFAIIPTNKDLDVGFRVVMTFRD